MPHIIISESARNCDNMIGRMQGPLKSYLEDRLELVDKKEMAMKIFKEVSSDHYAESYSGATSMDNFVPTVENGSFATTGFEDGYTGTIENVSWTNSFAISREMADDNSIMKSKTMASKFIRSYRRTKEQFFAQLLGQAIQGKTSFKIGEKTFSTKCADDSCVFSKSHKPKIKGGNQTNAFNLPFSVDNLNVVSTHMQNLKGDNGETIGLNPDTIIIPNLPDIKAAVWAVIASQQVPGSSNNDYNFQYGNYNVVFWSALNDYVKEGTSPWVLMDSGYNEDGDCAIFQNRVDLEVTSSVNPDTKANQWDGYARFAGGFIDFRSLCAGGVDFGTT